MTTEKIVPLQNATLPGKGVTFGRFFTKPGAHPLDEVKYVKRSSVITNPDGSVVFKMENVEVPESWSQLATDIIVSKYFRKAGVPETGSETSAQRAWGTRLTAIEMPIPDPHKATPNSAAPSAIAWPSR